MYRLNKNHQNTCFIQQISVLPTGIGDVEENRKNEEPSKEFCYPVCYQILLNISYYLCIVPYTVRSTGPSTFSIHTNLLQKVLSGLLHTMVLVYSVLKFIMEFSQSEVAFKQSRFYSLANFIGYNMQYLTFLRFCYLGKGKMFKAINYTGRSPNILAKICSVGACVYTFAISGYYVYSQWFKGFDDAATAKLVQKLTFQIARNSNATGTMTMSLYALTFTIFIMDLSRLFLLVFSELYPAFGCYAILELWTKYTKIIFNSSQTTTNIAEEFSACVKRNILINIAVGDITFWMMSCYFVLFPIGVPLILNNESPMALRVSLCISFTVISIQMLIAGMGCEKGNKLRRMVQKELSERKIMEPDSCYLTREIQCMADSVEEIGVRGGQFFLVSFSFLGRVSSTTFGYVIMAIGFQKSEA